VAPRVLLNALVLKGSMMVDEGEEEEQRVFKG
jgi:hypothetical protein